MKRVLVTGATGCVGRHVLPLLAARGWEVHATHSKQAAVPSIGVEWHRANLLDSGEGVDLVRAVKPSHLLHLAWYIAPGKWATATENLDWVEASMALARIFKETGGVRIVTSGSCLEYDWNYGYCSEELTPRAPHTLYGSCKNAVQLLTTAFAASTQLSSAWGRIFFLYGPYEHPDRLVASVIRSLLKGEPARVSHGRQVRDYLFVSDVADAFVSLLEADVTGPFNIASGNPVMLRDIVMKIGEILGRPELIQLGAIPAAATDTPLVVGDPTRLKKLLGWSPKFDLEAGLRETIAWWQRQ